MTLRQLYNYLTLIAMMIFAPLGMASAQEHLSPKEVETLIKDGHSYFYFEEYEEALPLYLQALSEQPQNANLQYCIGFCYLHIAGRKHNSIAYLEEAVKQMSRRHRPNSPTETQAPFDALFYLGNAYFVNNQLDKATEQYQRFKKTFEGKRRSNWNTDYLEHQTAAIEAARKAQQEPVDFMMRNIGGQINDRFNDFNAVLSGDGQTLAFTSKRKFYNAVMISRRQADSSWSKPVNITLDLKVNGICNTLSLSFDGTRLYLLKEEDQDGNIFMSRYDGQGWSEMQKLGRNINTQYYESHASESPCGKYLVFSSNRDGGYGDLDLYISQRTAEGDWGPALNMGPIVNTPYNENTPFFTTDGALLFFSSEGHTNTGCYDVFVSQNNDYINWSAPTNVGYPLNTPDDDLFLFPIGNGSRALMSRFGPNGSGGQNIYELTLFTPTTPQKLVQSDSPLRPKKGTDFAVVDTAGASQGFMHIDSVATIPIFGIDTLYRPTLYFEGKPYEAKPKAGLNEQFLQRFAIRPKP